MLSVREQHRQQPFADSHACISRRSEHHHSSAAGGIDPAGWRGHYRRPSAVSFSHHRAGDSLDNQKMGYKYAKTPLPWLDSKPVPTKKKGGYAAKSKAPFVTSVFPVTLDKVVQVKVARPKKSRTAEVKEAEEILLIEGIEVAIDKYAKFDVYLNEEDDPSGGKDKAEFAGSFAHLPHKHKGMKKIRTTLSLGLNESLEDLGAEDDDAILVTLAPKVGGGVVSVDNIKIVYDS